VSIASTVGAPLALELLGHLLSLPSVAPTFVMLLVLVAWVLDLRAEHQARRQLGALVEVHDVQRVAEVDAALSALRAEGMEAFARGLHTSAPRSSSSSPPRRRCGCWSSRPTKRAPARW
jgi:hypothetical protein